MSARAFLSTLNYSSCNEDWETERRALRIGPGDRILCVAGSGDRPLHLLLDAPAGIVAIDFNANQIRLLELKIAALTTFDYDEYVEFLGLHEPTRDLDALAARLPAPLRDFWRSFDGEPVLYSGRWERYYRALSRLSRMMRGRTIRDLLSIKDLDEQRAFVRDRWDRWWWRLTFDVLCSRGFSRLFLADPAFYANVDPHLGIGRYIYDGMLRVLDRRLARENFMLALVLAGRLSPHDLPPYLRAESFGPLRELAHRIETRAADLVGFLEKTDERFTRFSFSDVPSYLRPAGFGRLLDGMVRSAAPGARFCIRQFLTGHRVPGRFDGILRREPELEEELRREDRAFAYRFIVGTIGR